MSEEEPHVNVEFLNLVILQSVSRWQLLNLFIQDVMFDPFCPSPDPFCPLPDPFRPSPDKGPDANECGNNARSRRRDVLRGFLHGVLLNVL